jgi:hypothetical protein
MKNVSKMDFPKNHVVLSEEEKQNVEGGHPVVVAVAGIVVTVTIFTWNQGEKDAAAWVGLYGKSTATALGAAIYVQLMMRGTVYVPLALAYQGGFNAELRRH